VTAAHFHKIFSVILQHGNVSKLKYLGTTPTNRNDIHHGIKKINKSGYAFYYSLRKMLSFRLLYKTSESRIQKTITLSVESWV